MGVGVGVGQTSNPGNPSQERNDGIVIPQGSSIMLVAQKLPWFPGDMFIVKGVLEQSLYVITQEPSVVLS